MGDALHPTLPDYLPQAPFVLSSFVLGLSLKRLIHEPFGLIRPTHTPPTDILSSISCRITELS
jgi:hypothetical protein